MRLPRFALPAVALATIAGPIQAGPPFLTDDPMPTDPGHWEIYAPVGQGGGMGGSADGSFGAELNYGALPGVQLTVGLPIAAGRDADGWHFGRGDLALSAKYRFYHDAAAGLSIAAFPGITLPTASHGLGNHKVTALLPVWAEKDSGAWSLFGGGGYAINPGTDNRNYWTGGVAVTRAFSSRLLIGAEADRQGADTIDGRASTSLGLGTIVKLKAPFELLASGGPTFVDGSPHAGWHGYVALGIVF